MDATCKFSCNVNYGLNRYSLKKKNSFFQDFLENHSNLGTTWKNLEENSFAFNLSSLRQPYKLQKGL